MAPDRPSVPRCLAVWSGATAATAVALWWLWPDLAHTSEGSLEAVLARGAAVAATLCIGWGWAATTASTLAAVRGRPWTRLPGCPQVLQRAVLAACGVAVVSGLAGAAQAAEGDRGAAVVQGLPLPDRPVSAAPHAPAPAPKPPAAPARTRRDRDVVVAAGDSLWSIAERQLPPGVGDITVEEAWQRIYAANRDLIGKDPDVIQPGQRLRLPRPGVAR